MRSCLGYQKFLQKLIKSPQPSPPYPVSTKSVSCSPSKDNAEPNKGKKDDLKGDIDLINTEMENINQSSNSTNTAEEKLKEKLKAKLVKQLTSSRENCKKKYYQSHFHKITDSPPLSQGGSVIVCDETKNLHQQEGKLKSNKIKKKSVLAAGDSMVNGMEESKLSKTRHIRVQPMPGAKIEDVESNFDELLPKDLRITVIHIGTNNSVTDSSQVIFDKLLLLKKEIQSVVPNCTVIISNLIKQTEDNCQANSVNEKVNELLKNSKLHVINNDKSSTVFAYRRPRNTNKHTFFDELSISLDQITSTYENFIVTGDLNIDILDDSMDTNSYLSDFCDTYSLMNLIFEKLCSKAVSGIRGGSRAAATSKMEHFVIIVNGFQALTIITKRSIFDVAAALDLPLGISVDVMHTYRLRSFQKTAILKLVSVIITN